MTTFNRRSVLTGATALTATALASGKFATPVRAAAPMSGKQAPGFYRYKVGDYEVTVVTDGSRAAPLQDNAVRGQTKESVSSALASIYPSHQKDFATTAVTPVVVNTGSKLIVIDTGTGPITFEQSKGALGQFHTNLDVAGIDRNTVDTVIISHFHPDHLGGLVTADGKTAFPNAEVLVPTAEWTFWMDDARMNAAPEGARGAFQNARRVFGVVGKQVTQYDSGKEVAPGITSVFSPGHTPGHTSHVVASGNSKVLVQADITAGPALLFVRNPGWHYVFDADGPLAEQSRRKLYDMAAAEKMPVQAYHFPFPAAGHIEKDGDGYRMIPIAWSAVL